MFGFWKRKASSEGYSSEYQLFMLHARADADTMLLLMLMEAMPKEQQATVQSIA
jgi:hypothetical protein